MLRLDWCSHRAAAYAVRAWHYTHSMPTPPLVLVGVWEDERFIGAICFSRGSNKNLARSFGVSMTAIAELSRIALAPHRSPTSRIVRVALAMLHRHSPGTLAVVSYADPSQHHDGRGVYAAGNWLYLGTTTKSRQFIDERGRRFHPRQVSATGWKPQYGQLRRVPRIADLTAIALPPKHRYIYVFDHALRESLREMAGPYPKREREADSGRPATPSGRGGASPTRSLHLSEGARV